MCEWSSFYLLGWVEGVFYRSDFTDAASFQCVTSVVFM